MRAETGREDSRKESTITTQALVKYYLHGSGPAQVIKGQSKSFSVTTDAGGRRSLQAEPFLTQYSCCNLEMFI